MLDQSIEFVGIRSQYYKEIMEEFPNAREEEKALALHYLSPQKNEKILEVGAGGGFFSCEIAKRVAPSIYVVTDPSEEQLKDLKEKEIENLHCIVASGDALPIGIDNLEKSTFDAIFTGGAFHHVPNKMRAFDSFSQLLKPGGRLVISDVFLGSNLAKHFDLEVAKYCATGHEVAFLSEEFAASLCYLFHFEKPEFQF